MAYKLTQKEIENVLKLEAPKRYKYFISKIVDQDELWSLKNNDGFIGMGDNEGHDGIPFWPHIEYAKLFINNEWENCEPAKINFHHFLDYWIPEMIKDNTHIIVFPTLEMKGLILHPNVILKDLVEENKKIE